MNKIITAAVVSFALAAGACAPTTAPVVAPPSQTTQSVAQYAADVQLLSQAVGTVASHFTGTTASAIAADAVKLAGLAAQVASTSSPTGQVAVVVQDALDLIPPSALTGLLGTVVADIKTLVGLYQTFGGLIPMAADPAAVAAARQRLEAVVTRR